MMLASTGNNFSYMLLFPLNLNQALLTTLAGVSTQTFQLYSLLIHATQACIYQDESIKEKALIA